MVVKRGAKNTVQRTKTESLEELMNRGIERSLYSAAVGLVMCNSQEVFSYAAGTLSDDLNSPLATITTIFDAASITKPITALLLLQCVQNGLLHLEQPLMAILPEAVDTPTARVTIRQLATHTSGLPAWKAVHHASNPIAAILTTQLEAVPGEQYCYSDLGYILLGYIVERMCSTALDNLAHDKIFKPLGMQDSTFNPSHELHSRIASTTAPKGKVHDPNARGLGGVAGHAGLFTTAGDLALLATALLGALGGTTGDPERQVLCTSAARLAATRQTNEGLSAHTIGWFAWPNGYLPKADLLSTQTFGHTGFTGTMLLIDPRSNTIVVFLTNRVLFENNNDGSEVLTMRRLFANVAGSFVKS